MTFLIILAEEKSTPNWKTLIIKIKIAMLQDAYICIVINVVSARILRAVHMWIRRNKKIKRRSPAP